MRTPHAQRLVKGRFPTNRPTRHAIYAVTIVGAIYDKSNSTLENGKLHTQTHIWRLYDSHAICHIFLDNI